MSIGESLSNFGQLVFNAIAHIIISLYEALFAIAPLRTEGLWPLGRPIAPSGAVGPEIVYTGEFVAYVADQTYDKVAPSQGGELLVFSLTLFAILYIVGGYAQFFDWKLEDPRRKRDPVIGFMLILLWFPLYYGFLSIIHQIVLTFPISRSEISLFIIGAGGSAWMLGPVGAIAFKIGGIGVAIISLFMYIRGIILGVYFLFGPTLIAIVWAEIPKFSDVAAKVLKGSIPIAIVPLPLYLMMGLVSLVFTRYPVTGAFQLVAGVIVFMVTVWMTVLLMWLVLTRTGRFIDTAGETAGKVGGSLGLAASGQTDEARRAAKYGPMSVITRQGFKNAGNRSRDARDWAGKKGSQTAEFAKRKGGEKVNRVRDIVNNYWK